MTAPRYDVLGIGNAIVDVIARAEDDFLVAQGMHKGTMALIDEARAQTIYAATVDHIREFGTLKAMGATNGYIYRVIVEQAVISAVGGYAIGMAMAQAASALSQRGTTAILLPWPLTAALFGITVGMCVLASIVSINKVTRLDPAIVFKG